VFIILIVIIGLSILILGHEAGHFLVAKLFKLKIDEFGFGFPPRMFGALRYRGKKTKGISFSEEIEIEVEKAEMGDREIVEEKIVEKIREVDEVTPIKNWRFFWGAKEPKREIGNLTADDTIYSLNWLPFGGFVRIAGENDRLSGDLEKLEVLPEEEKKRLFCFQPAWKRALILAAGVTINFIIGWLLISLIFMVGTPRALVISGIQKDSPAGQVGIVQGDVIKDFTKANEFIAFVDKHRGQEVQITVIRGGKELSFAAAPRMQPKEGEGALGVYLAEAGMPRHGFFQALFEGLKTSFQIAWLTLASFYELIKNLFFKASLLPGVVGPVGIFFVAQQTGHIGLIYLIQLIGLISINLTVINFIPFPALDGGRLFMILIEKIKGSPVSQKVEAWTNSLGFAFLIVLIALITVRDIGLWF
jgi:regulator of sigma E protease